MIAVTNMSVTPPNVQFNLNGDSDHKSDNSSSSLENKLDTELKITSPPRNPPQRLHPVDFSEHADTDDDMNHPLPRVQSPVHIKNHIDPKLAEDRYRSSAARHFEPISIPPSAITSEDEDDYHGSANSSTVLPPRTENALHAASPKPSGSTGYTSPALSQNSGSGGEGESDEGSFNTQHHRSPIFQAYPSSEDLVGDPNDPYRRTRRAPIKTNPHDIPSQFIFRKLGLHHGKHGHHGHSGSLSLKSLVPNHHDKHDKHDKHEKHHSSLDLRRFFKSHQKTDKEKKPSVSKSKSSANLQDDHFGLFKKYGKFGRMLGSGAGGSVRIMKRSSDGKIFAVKEFRARRPTETEREYARKVTAEFCIGSALHHTNIIETLDIVEENKKFYEVMEYAPYDMFSIVMSGKMTMPEVYCCFKQLLSGVAYLHSMGLAHRDLKLDNLVVDSNCFVKIIDFGSAVVFKYPFEADIVEATGVVGSDPYLAPETLVRKLYDPRAVDIWSSAIIFCCMALRRFPWKYPKLSDNSFRLFCMKQPSNDAESPSDILADIKKQRLVEQGCEPIRKTDESHSPNSKTDNSSTHKQELYGPWRLLRLLPRETRSVIAHMLELDPVKRYDIHRVFADNWINDISMCHMENGKVIHSPTHVHNLVASEESPAPPAKH